MSITFSINNGREYANANNLFKTEDLGDCQCIEFGFGQTEPTGKGIPECYSCNGTGRAVIETYPFETNTGAGFVEEVLRAISLNPCMHHPQEVSGQITGQELLEALITHEQKVCDLISQKGDSYSLQVFSAIKELANEAVKRGEQVIWE